MVNVSIFQLLVSAFLLCLLMFEPAYATKKSYIVYLGSHNHGPNPSIADLESATNFHYKLLGSVLGSHDRAKEAIFYSYNRHINGFAAVLEEQEAAEIARNPNVVSVFLNEMIKLHTTRSWQFLGLEENGTASEDSAWAKARYGSDTIIANLDTGVWPESKSFSDKGTSPIPLKWRGKHCQIDNFKCNRKVIGARFFKGGYEAIVGKNKNTSSDSARDTYGHGTHTLSTAGGYFVENASVFGLGNGTAKGGSPKARVAVYKVCWDFGFQVGCSGADILSGFEAAISDGVDVLSASLGGPPALFFQDPIAIGSFHAVSNGIVVVSSGGNAGLPASVSNVAPWMLTVAASSIDRDFASYVELGDKKFFMGESLSSTGLPSQEFYPLISSEDASHPQTPPLSTECSNLDPEKVKGKIVVCLGDYGGAATGYEASQAGAVGLILANEAESGNQLIADAHVLPASNVNFKDGQYIYSYIKNTSENPVGNLTRPKTELRKEPAPFITAFSSKGPNPIQPSILKPDITAPGLNIIAAFSKVMSPSFLDSDKRRIPFTVMSGTSMSSPHVAGVVGLLKTLHPDWSPAAIKSAIMTTATTDDDSGKPIKDALQQKATPFSYGSGHIQPHPALDPGLVYDLSIADYLNLLCAYNYTQEQLRIIYHKNFTCPLFYNMLDFNYPSITIVDLAAERVTVTREVKNVGTPGTYVVGIKPPYGIKVNVEPSSLTFKEIGEKQRFNVTLIPFPPGKKKDYVFGELRWSDGKHKVRSPIVVKNSW
ncbi:hypothetical protein L6164_030953 [Bauhinia variegata]|uniref:Uncharacterized protein n=1 Tax=Bauhinia variegata TaxID=167791 RepID=A0ACB9LEE3_BAUVA|nr:hypothetical protein L6164_030953 [Bauhinia variegata]